MTEILHQALAIFNRRYTNQVRLRGLMENKGFCKPAQAGFVCVDAVKTAQLRMVQDIR